MSFAMAAVDADTMPSKTTLPLYLTKSVALVIDWSNLASGMAGEMVVINDALCSLNRSIN